MARLIDEKTLRLELDKLNCIDKFGYVILPITKFNIALKISTVDAVPVVHAHWVSLEPVIGLYECSLCGHKNSSLKMQLLSKLRLKNGR